MSKNLYAMAFAVKASTLTTITLNDKMINDKNLHSTGEER